MKKRENWHLFTQKFTNFIFWHELKVHYLLWQTRFFQITRCKKSYLRKKFTTGRLKLCNFLKGLQLFSSEETSLRYLRNPFSPKLFFFQLFFYFFILENSLMCSRWKTWASFSILKSFFGPWRWISGIWESIVDTWGFLVLFLGHLNLILGHWWLISNLWKFLFCFGSQFWASESNFFTYESWCWAWGCLFRISMIESELLGVNISHLEVYLKLFWVDYEPLRVTFGFYQMI